MTRAAEFPSQTVANCLRGASIGALLLAASSCVGSIGDGATLGSQPPPAETPPAPFVPTPQTPITTPGVEAVACQSDVTGPVFHRLNRTEFQNSVNALLGTQLALRDGLPDDDLVDGFDNSADVSVSATLLLKYLDNVEQAVGKALADPALAAKLIPCDVNAAACAPADPRGGSAAGLSPAGAGRRGRRVPEVRHHLQVQPARRHRLRAAGRAGLGQVPLPRRIAGPDASDAVCGVARPLTSGNRTDLSHARLGRAAVVLPDQQHARRPAAGAGQPGQAERSRRSSPPRSSACWPPTSAPGSRGPSSKACPRSGCRSIWSRARPRRPRCFPALGRTAARGDAVGIEAVFRRAGALESLGAGPGAFGLHLPERAPGQTLRHHRRHRHPDAQGGHHRHRARRA